MRLSIFAFHVSQILNSAPGKFHLTPCPRVTVEVKIVKGTCPDLEDAAWDTVYINGKVAGNRQGGVIAFTALVNAAKPVIEYS